MATSDSRQIGKTLSKERLYLFPSWDDPYQGVKLVIKIMFVHRSCFIFLTLKDPAVHRRRSQTITIKRDFGVYLALPISFHKVEKEQWGKQNSNFLTDFIEFGSSFSL